MSIKTDQQKVCKDEVEKYRPGDNIAVVDVVITLQFVLEELERTKEELRLLKKSLGG